MPTVFAHSAPDADRTLWEPLADHLQEVAARAREFAAPFGWAGLAFAAGLLHDIGKVSGAYQSYISAPPDSGQKGPDHSTAGAREAERRYGPGFGRLIAYAVAGHHAGLADHTELERRTTLMCLVHRRAVLAELDKRGNSSSPHRGADRNRHTITA